MPYSKRIWLKRMRRSSATLRKWRIFQVIKLQTCKLYGCSGIMSWRRDRISKGFFSNWQRSKWQTKTCSSLWLSSHRALMSLTNLYQNSKMLKLKMGGWSKGSEIVCRTRIICNKQFNFAMKRYTSF